MIMVADGLGRLAAGPPTTEQVGLVAPARTVCSSPLVSRVNRLRGVQRVGGHGVNQNKHPEVDRMYPERGQGYSTHYATYPNNSRSETGREASVSLLL